MKLTAIISLEVKRWWISLFSWIPGHFGALIRFLAYKFLFKKTKGYFTFIENNTISYPEKMEIGKNFGINKGGWINARGGIKIGDDVIIGPNCVITSTNHKFIVSNINPKPFRKLGSENKAVEIGNNVWIAANVIILPGVKVGDNCVIGAGSVVTKSIERNSVAVGAPAKVIKKL